MKKLLRFLLASVILLVLCGLAYYVKLSIRDNYYTATWPTRKDSPPLNLSAELLSKRKLSSDSPFDIKIGMTGGGVYQYATFEIFAPGFQITDKNGVTYTDSYSVLYNDFKDEKYGIIHDGKGHLVDLKYFETFTFQYIGEESHTAGSISFLISALQHSEPATEAELNFGPCGNHVSIYYEIKNGKIKLTAKNPNINRYYTKPKPIPAVGE